MKKNIVFIGMPCCGKTTMGTLLADRLGRRLVDIDVEIEREEGMPIPEIFRLHGEKYFRDIESGVVERASRTEDGRVIATGGGSILRAENVEALKRTGTLFFLDRPLRLLRPADDRPLSNDPEKLKAMFEVRYPIYLACADHCLNAEGMPDEILSQMMTYLENIREEDTALSAGRPEEI